MRLGLTLGISSPAIVTETLVDVLGAVDAGLTSNWTDNGDGTFDLTSSGTGVLYFANPGVHKAGQLYRLTMTANVTGTGAEVAFRASGGGGEVVTTFSAGETARVVDYTRLADGNYVNVYANGSCTDVAITLLKWEQVN